MSQLAAGLGGLVSRTWEGFHKNTEGETSEFSLKEEAWIDHEHFQ